MFPIKPGFNYLMLVNGYGRIIIDNHKIGTHLPAQVAVVFSVCPVCRLYSRAVIIVSIIGGSFAITLYYATAPLS